eukprot:scaffold9262_cov107-Cylindrotheca_fusiformis.AAC.1
MIKDDDNNPSPVKVICVLKKNAKLVKTALEEANLLNKNYRMVPSQEWPDCIAVPVLHHGIPVENGDDRQQQLSWTKWIEHESEQICPYSTSVLGNFGQLQQQQQQQQQKASADATSNSGGGDAAAVAQQPMTPSQQAIYDTIRNMSTNHPDHNNDILILQKIQELHPSVCPKKLEVFGDDRTLVIPSTAFQGSSNEFFFFDSLIRLFPSTNDDNKTNLDHHTVMDFFWKRLAAIHKSQRIVRKGTVNPNSKIRESGHRLVWPVSGIPETTGIGYYTLPAILHGNASHVYACEWNEYAIHALRYNIQDNRIDKDRVTVLVGDSRISVQQQIIDHNHGGVDRVSLGLLPSSEGGWRTAVRAIKDTGGSWLHIHANVPIKEVDQWTLWTCFQLLQLVQEEKKKKKTKSNWIVVCNHVEKVKSFAPTVAHYVADVYIADQQDDSALTVQYKQQMMMMNDNDVGSDMAGAIINGSFVPCPTKNIETPSCALSPNGVLSQEWMR